MKKIICLLICVCALFCTAYAKNDNILYVEATPLPILEEEPEEVSAATVEGEVRLIVTFFENAEECAQNVKSALSYEQLMQNIYAFDFADLDIAKEAYEMFKSDENVKSVDFDAYVELVPDQETFSAVPVEEENIVSAAAVSDKPNDYASYEGQWYLDDVGAYNAWQEILSYDEDAPKRSAVVAVLDSGVDTSSPDLKNRIVTDESGNYVGFNTIYANSTSFEDDYSTNNTYHGTAVSSFIAAEANNGSGIAGVTGEYDVKILPVKVLNSSGGGSMSSIIKGFDIAVENNADVINMSLTAIIPFYLTDTNDDGEIVIISTLQDAINLATQNGITVVAAAGNYYSNMPLFPASYDNVISVAAYNSNRERAAFSQYNDYIDISAPGISMTHIGKTETEGVNSVKSGSGTSYAAPMVSAAAALLKIAYPDITPREISNFLKLSATDLGKEGYDQMYGHGALNIEKAVKMLSIGGYSPITSVEYPESLSVKVGEHAQIGVKVLPAYASNKYVRYESYDTSVATVSNNGVVYGVGPGTVEILIIPDDTEEVFVTTLVVHPNPSIVSDGDYSRQIGTPASKIDISGDEFLFYSDGYLWSGETDLIDGTPIIRPTMSVSGDYGYCAVLPKNKENVYSAMYSYVIFNTSTGSFIFSNSPTFPKGRYTIKDDNKSESESYIDYTNNGQDIIALTDAGRIVKIIAPTSETPQSQVASVIPLIGEKEIHLDKIGYISHEKCGYYIGVGFDTSNNQYIIMSENGYDEWGFIPFSVNTANNTVKDIVIDGQYVYMLTDDAFYYIKTGRNADTTMAASTPAKIYDVDAQNIKEIMFYTQNGKMILVGLGNDGKLYAIADDGAVNSFNPSSDLTNISHMFDFCGDVYMVSDGSLKTADIYMFAQNKSLAPEFLTYDVNIIDKNNKLVDSPSTDGEFTVEYYIESIAPMEFDNEKYTVTNDTAQDKYPAQVVFAVYERVTDKLVDIKMRNFTLDYNQKYDLGAFLRWEEPFNLGEGNYYVKVMTFKGNNFYWPERNNSGTTMDVFTQVHKK